MIISLFFVSRSIWLGSALKLSRIVEIGTVNTRSPTVISIPSIIARVSGILMINVVPSPFLLSTMMEPPHFSTFAFTTSMPTPRPLNSVTVSLVEKPGRRMMFCISVYSLSGLVRRPCFLALFMIFSGSMPAPSSDTVMITSPEAFCAVSFRVPFAGLPSAVRSSTCSSIP